MDTDTNSGILNLIVISTAMESSQYVLFLTIAEHSKIALYFHLIYLTLVPLISLLLTSCYMSNILTSEYSPICLTY